MKKEDAREILDRTARLLVHETAPHLLEQLRSIQALKRKLDEAGEHISSELEAAIRMIDKT